MKKLFILVLAAMLLGLCGCGLLPEKAEPMPTEQTAAVTETKPTEVVTEATTAPTEAEPIFSVVDTAYYTLTLPEEWVGKVLCELHEGDDGRYSLGIYEIRDRLDFGGGKLFSLTLLPSGEDYTVFPSYELVGSLLTPEGEFYLVALFPTDVQSSEENRSVYFALNEQVQDVIYTVMPKDGVEMAMP